MERTEQKTISVGTSGAAEYSEAVRSRSTEPTWNESDLNWKHFKLRGLEKLDHEVSPVSTTLLPRKVGRWACFRGTE